MCTAMTSGTPTDPANDMLIPPPNLEFLDLSTCGVLESEVDTILVRFPALKHLVLDGCAVLRGELREGEWNALGKRCALVGVKRAKETEKALKAWFEARSLSAVGDGLNQGSNNISRRAKRGRKGLATATISLRTPEPESTANGTSSGSRPPSIVVPQTTIKRASKIRILPSPPSLSSLSITISPLVKEDKYPMIRAEFEAGWAEGVAILAVTKARLRTSARNGFRIMRSSPDRVEGLEEAEIGLDDLEDVKADDDEAFGSATEEGANSMALSPPVLCFAGPHRDGLHQRDCGHSVGWETMGDVVAV